MNPCTHEHGTMLIGRGMPWGKGLNDRALVGGHALGQGAALGQGPALWQGHALGRVAALGRGPAKVYFSLQLKVYVSRGRLKYTAASFISFL